MNTIRWIALLPAALIAAYLGHLAIQLIGAFGRMAWGDDNLFMFPIWEFVAHLVAGFTFVYGGCFTAPIGKSYVGFVLASIASAAAIYAAVTNFHILGWYAISSATALVIGAFYAAVKSFNEGFDYFYIGD